MVNMVSVYLCFYNPLYNAPVLLLRLPAKRAVSRNYSDFTPSVRTKEVKNLRI